MAETLLSGGNLLNIFFAVLFTNARLFPMTMHVIPTIKTNKIQTWKYFLLCHFIAVTAWINYILVYKKINLNNRYNIFLVYLDFYGLVQLFVPCLVLFFHH